MTDDTDGLEAAIAEFKHDLPGLVLSRLMFGQPRCKLRSGPQRTRPRAAGLPSF